MDPTRLNHSLQAHATQTHSALSQLLATTPGTTALGATACAELQAVYCLNERIIRALSVHTHSSATDDTDDLQEVCNRRASLLAKILQQLDESVCSLHSQVDDCHRVLRSAPCTSDPERVMQYAHTLRYGFQPLGILDYHPPVPPAPQDFHFIPALLKQHHECKAQQRGVTAAAAPQQALPDVAQQQQEQQQVQEHNNPVVQQQVQQPPLQPQQLPVAGAILGQLNEDLSDETADEELSETEDDDDDY